MTACVGCEGGGTIPSGRGGFPTGSLLCLNEQAGSGQVCEANAVPFAFQDPNDFMTCRGRHSCVNNWKVTNVGAVCCSAALGGGSCKGNPGTAEFTMNADGESSCTSDVCCDGSRTCDTATFTGVNSVSCRGWEACQTSEFSLARNLYCSSESLVKRGDFWNVCRAGKFTFTAGGTHCVQCLGANVCEDSDFDFNDASEVSINCVGDTTCKDAVFVLQDNSKIEMVCDGSDACSGNADVRLGGSGSEMHLTCLNGACNGLRIKRDSGKCVCTDETNECNLVRDCSCPGRGCVVDVPSVCSSDASDSACCAGANQGDHPDCGQCCPVSDVTTSSTTTTTSTGGGGGDPHIDTFDGQHYLLLKQGSFSFWHFSGCLFAK